MPRRAKTSGRRRHNGRLLTRTLLSTAISLGLIPGYALALLLSSLGDDYCVHTIATSIAPYRNVAHLGHLNFAPSLYRVLSLPQPLAHTACLARCAQISCSRYGGGNTEAVL